jgi:hypothetical protein
MPLANIFTVKRLLWKVQRHGLLKLNTQLRCVVANLKRSVTSGYSRRYTLLDIVQVICCGNRGGGGGGGGRLDALELTLKSLSSLSLPLSPIVGVLNDRRKRTAPRDNCKSFSR